MAAICIAGAGDLPAILDLWKRAGTEPGHTDDIESLTKLITRDPGALLVAVEDETIAGSVIAAWDGWRGNMYRLAVLPEARRAGIASELVREGERRLAERGARRLSAVVLLDEPGAAAFWERAGYEHRREAGRFAKVL